MISYPAVMLPPASQPNRPAVDETKRNGARQHSSISGAAITKVTIPAIGLSFMGPSYPHAHICTRGDLDLAVAV